MNQNDEFTIRVSLEVQKYINAILPLILIQC